MVSFQVNQLLADVGGVIALWLGLSFFSVLEFLQLAYDLILILIKKCLSTFTFHNKVQQQDMHVSEQRSDGVLDRQICKQPETSDNLKMDNFSPAKSSGKTCLPIYKQRVRIKGNRKHCRCKKSYWGTQVE